MSDPGHTAIEQNLNSIGEFLRQRGDNAELNFILSPPGRLSHSLQGGPMPDKSTNRDLLQYSVTHGASSPGLNSGARSGPQSSPREQHSHNMIEHSFGQNSMRYPSQPRGANSKEQDDKYASGGTEIPQVLEIFEHYDKLSQQLSEVFESRLSTMNQALEQERALRADAEAKLEVEQHRRVRAEDDRAFFKREAERERARAKDKEEEIRKMKRMAYFAQHQQPSQRPQSEDESQREYQVDSSQRDQEGMVTVARVVEMENKVRELEDLVDQLASEKQRLAEELSKAIVSQPAKKGNTPSMQEQKGELEQVIKDLQKDRAEMTVLVGQLANSKESLVSLSNQNQELRERLEASKQENTQLIETLKQLSSAAPSVSLITAERDNLLSELTTKTQALNNTVAKVNSLETELRSAKDKVDKLLSLNTFLESSLKSSEAMNKMNRLESHDETEVLKDRVQSMVQESEKLRRTNREIKLALDLKETEGLKSKRREDELSEKINILHDELVGCNAQLSHLSGLNDSISRENDTLKKLADKFSEEVDELRLRNEAQSKGIKAYEMLLSEIGKSVERGFDHQIEVPEFSIECFSNSKARDAFMDLLLNFEETLVTLLGEGVGKSTKQSTVGLKKTATAENSRGKLGSGSKNIRTSDEFTNQSRTQKQYSTMDALEQEQIATTRELRIYEEMVTKLQETLIDCFGVFEEVLEEPERVRELTEVFIEYYKCRIDLERVEMDLINQQEAARHARVNTYLTIGCD
jgi:uncharacterized coiled-coil DUF342 family protein